VPAASLRVEQVLILLAESPSLIAAATSGLTPVQLRTPPEAGEWSANDVLVHLRSCADVWGEAIARMLTEQSPTIRAISPRAWIKKTDYPDLAFRPSLRSYLLQRTELLAVLEPLAPEAWTRGAMVRGAGAPLMKTVLDYADRLARHERQHVAQVERVARTLRSPTR
jgi:hypothetical protein